MGEWTYEKAGVSIERAESFVEYIKGRVESLSRQTLLFGGFASGLALEGYKKPVLMMTTDGVGTKLKVAQEVGIHHTVGIDLVAMNVNDLLTTGAEPLAFLDYIATGRLELEVMKSVMDGIIEGCRKAGVALVGGETAEMPDFYPEGVYDLAGFCVGVVEKEGMITGESIEPEDVLVGLPSSGFHSNGFSLIRKVLQSAGVNFRDRFGEGEVWQILLEPTSIYTQEVKSLKENGISIKGMAHITGGGIPGNLVRILPEGCRAVVDSARIPANPVFEWIRDLGRISSEEMFKTFNMGVGYVFVLSPRESEKALKLLSRSFVLGHIEKGERSVKIV